MAWKSSPLKGRGRMLPDWRKSFYYHYYEFPGAHAVRRHYGVRTATHKLIHFYQNEEWELFDLQKDPEELKSVYGDSSYADVEASMKKELERLRKELKVPAEDPARPKRPKKKKPKR